MIKFVQADDEQCVRNINVAPDGSGPYSKVINWLTKEADGYILLFTDAADEGAVERYFRGANTSSSDPKSLAVTDDKIKVRVVSHSEFRGTGGKFIYKEAVLTPTRLTIQQYKIINNDIVIYRNDGDNSTFIIPILVNYTVTFKKSMVLLGARKATVSFSNLNCEDGSLFYKITGNNTKYPITNSMIKNSFSVTVGKENLAVFSAGKYSQYYNVKQKRV